MNISTANDSSAVIPEVDTTLRQAVCAVNLILSVPTNGFILWLIVTGEGGTITNDFFALNLSVSEIFYCLSCVLFIIGEHIQITALRKLGKFGSSILYSGRPLFQSCVCVELYLAVAHPVTFLKYKPLRYRMGSCGAVWLVVLAACLFDFLMGDSFANDYTFFVVYIVLTCVILFSCLSVLRALKQPGPGEGTREGEQPNNRKRRVFKNILIILVSMLMVFLPVIIQMSFTHVLDPMGKELFWAITLSLILIGGFVQPLIFLQKAGKLPCIRGQ